MIADDLSRIAMSSSLGEALSRAVDYARAQGHLEVALEHMLLSLCDDPDAGLVLAASNVDVTRLKAGASGYLSGLELRAAPGAGADPAVSPDLRRILEAAAAAARGGRRREINGAIVLAAIVGDGKSAAARLLQAQGLTFEGAIRALQRGTGVAPHAPPASTEDILASARERVQSRTIPSRRPDVHRAPEPEEALAETAAPAPMPEPAGYDDVPPTRPPRVEAASAEEPAPAQEPPPPEPEPPEVMAPPEPAAKAHPAAAKTGGLLATIRSRVEPLEPAEKALPPMPASPPLPPPLPVPEAGPSWTPPPAPERAVPPLAAPARPLPPPLPPVPPVRIGGEAPRPGPPPLKRRPETEEPRRPMGVGAADDGASTRFGTVLAQRRSSPGAMPAPPPMARPVPAPRAEIGQLVENIPRTMRVAVPALVEVRIARAEVQALAEGLQGGGAAHRHDVTITKAMSVRLRAPDGGFFIETASPETQWVEKTILLSADDFASWRWHVTPRETGRKRLQLIISARTVSAEGLAAETALPDQVITVRVKTNYARSISHWAGWGIAALIGGLLAKFGEGAFDAGLQIVAKIVTG